MKNQVFNPFLPSYEYIPDGEPRVFGDRIYLFGSHDKFNGKDYCENDYVAWSAPITDLSDWRYEGVIYRKDQHPYKIGRNILFAPDVVQGRDGRYYLYYSVADSSIISVAVSQRPEGPYVYYGDVKYSNNERVGEKAGEHYQFDPAVLVDEQGVYLYSGFTPNRPVDSKGRLHQGAHVSKLADNMLTVIEGPKIILPREFEVPRGAEFFEACSIRKIKGLYYLVYSARLTGLHYCTSQYPDGEFKYRGRIHSTSDIGIKEYCIEAPAYPNGNTHGGIACINGKYYIFNHRHTNLSSYCRQAIAEAIEIQEDGTIQQVESTSCGLNGEALRGTGRYAAYIACNLIDRAGQACITQDEEDRETGPDQYIKDIGADVIVGYKYFEFNNESYIKLKVRGEAKGEVHVSLDETFENIVISKIDLISKEWIDLSIPFETKVGKYPLFFRFKGEGKCDLLSFEIK